MTKSADGRIITFYSYKGGSGRTMTLANVAWLLADAGFSVCAIDWDLEAPGLHRYFAPFLIDPELISTDGLIDYVWSRTSHQLAVTADQELDGRPTIVDSAVGLNWEFANGGILDFVPAGRQGESYSRRVNTFDWNGFYARLGGANEMDMARSLLKETYDFTLIDSRTGVSDTSGVCTVQMPDSLVACYTLNRQSIFGVASVLERVRAQRADLNILPLETRVDTSEKVKLDAARRIARSQFENYLGDADSRAYWTDMEIPYWPFYAFAECLAPFGDDLEQPSGFQLVRAMERVATRVAGRSVQARAIASSERTRVLKSFLFETIDGLGESNNSSASRFWDTVASRFNSWLDEPSTAPLATPEMLAAMRALDDQPPPFTRDARYASFIEASERESAMSDRTAAIPYRGLMLAVIAMLVTFMVFSLVSSNTSAAIASTIAIGPLVLLIEQNFGHLQRALPGRSRNE